MGINYLIGCIVIGILTSVLGYSVIDSNGFNFKNFVIVICFNTLWYYLLQKDEK